MQSSYWHTILILCVKNAKVLQKAEQQGRQGGCIGVVVAPFFKAPAPEQYTCISHNNTHVSAVQKSEIRPVEPREVFSKMKIRRHKSEAMADILGSGNVSMVIMSSS